VHQRCFEIFSTRRPIQRISPCATLRVLDDNRFVLVCSSDGWQTNTTIQSRSLGSAGFSADIVPEAGETPSALSLTFFWPEENRWLGHNYDIRIEG